MENNPQDVLSAFEILLEAIKAEIEFVNGIGSKSFATGDYKRVTEAAEHAKRLTAFRDKAAALRQEWQDLTAQVVSQEDDETRSARRNLERLRRGRRTPES